MICGLPIGIHGRSSKEVSVKSQKTSLKNYSKFTVPTYVEFHITPLIKKIKLKNQRSIHSLRLRED